MTNLHVEAAYEAERSLGSWGKRRCMSESYKTPRVPAGFRGEKALRHCAQNAPSRFDTTPCPAEMA